MCCGFVFVLKGRGKTSLLCGAACVLGGTFVWLGKKVDCGQADKQDGRPFHSRNTVSQKYLTWSNYRNTVIVMANVLNKDKQIAIIGALAEGSSIRSIERLYGRSPRYDHAAWS
jgi:hypothetical protein